MKMVGYLDMVEVSESLRYNMKEKNSKYQGRGGNRDKEAYIETYYLLPNVML